ncbi:hypothetical protein CXG81DRAFT_10506, partial [Caulochytrium protostelioides]
IDPSSFPQGSRDVVIRPDQVQMPHFDDVTFPSLDGTPLTAYLIRCYRDRRPGAADDGAADGDSEVLATDTLIFLHGNAGNIGHRLPLAFHFHTTVRCNVLLLSYRGYGKSGGAASERGIKQDVEAALLWVRGHPDLAGARIVMYGQSIGGAAAIHAAALPAHRHTLAGLILENTFTSLPRLVPHALPQIAWLSFLCTQRWPSDRDITRLDPRLPVLFLSGARDELVPPTMMHELARLLYASRAGRAAEARGVRWRVFPAGTHNDTCVQPGYFAEIGAFWAERLLPR